MTCLQLQRAFALSLSFSHGWAHLAKTCPRTWGEAQAIYDAEKARLDAEEQAAAEEMTAREYARIAAAGGWVSGLNVRPLAQFYDAGIAPASKHTTNSMRSSWTIAKDGTASFEARNEDGDKVWSGDKLIPGGPVTIRAVVNPDGSGRVDVSPNADAFAIDRMAWMLGAIGAEYLIADIKADRAPAHQWRNLPPPRGDEAAILARYGLTG